MIKVYKTMILKVNKRENINIESKKMKGIEWEEKNMFEMIYIMFNNIQLNSSLYFNNNQSFFI